MLNKGKVQVYLGTILGAKNGWSMRSTELVEFTMDYEVVRPEPGNLEPVDNGRTLKMSFQGGTI